MPQDGQRDPKGHPKGAQRAHKGSQMEPKVVPKEAKAGPRRPKEPKKKIYVYKKLRIDCPSGCYVIFWNVCMGHSDGVFEGLTLRGYGVICNPTVENDVPPLNSSCLNMKLFKPGKCHSCKHFSTWHFKSPGGYHVPLYNDPMGMTPCEEEGW